MEEDGAEKLMSTLISKMESIDQDVQILKAENAALRKMVDSPAALLRKAGYVSVRTPLADDVSTDPLRGDFGVDAQTVVKSDNSDSFSNEDIHNMSWSEIHEMTEQTREVKEMY